MLGDEGGEVRHYLLDLRAAAGKAGDGGRAGQDERRDLFREPLNVGLALPANADPELHLGDVSGGFAGKMPVGRVNTDELAKHDVELEAEPIEPFAEYAVGGLGLLVGVRPGIYERTDGFPAMRVSDRNLIELGVRAALYAENAHAVRAGVFELNGREIGDNIRRDVGLRVAHFVEKLFFDTLHVNTPAGAVVFGDDELAARPGLNDRKADASHVGDRVPLELAVAARGLSPAFDDVAGDRSGRDQVPLIELPAKFVHQRSKRQARIGQPAADDDACTAIKSLNQAAGTEIDVRRLNLVANGRERLAGVHVGDLNAAFGKFIKPRKNVIAGDHADLELAAEPELAGRFADRLGTAFDVDPAGVRKHLDVLLDAIGQYLAHQRDKVAGIAGVRVALPLLLNDRHRHLGEVIEHKVVDRPAADLIHRCRKHVTPKTLSASNSDLLFHKRLLMKYKRKPDLSEKGCSGNREPGSQLTKKRPSGRYSSQRMEYPLIQDLLRTAYNLAAGSPRFVGHPLAALVGFVGDPTRAVPYLEADVFAASVNSACNTNLALPLYGRLGLCGKRVAASRGGGDGSAYKGRRNYESESEESGDQFFHRVFITPCSMFKAIRGQRHPGLIGASDVRPDEGDDILGRSSGKENLRDALIFQYGDVLGRHNSSNQDERIIHSIFAEKVDDARAEGLMSPAEDRDTDGINILLKGRGGNHLRRLSEPGVNDLHSRVAECTGDDLRSTVVTVQARLGHQNPNLTFAHKSVSILPANVSGKRWSGGRSRFGTRFVQFHVWRTENAPKLSEHTLLGTHRLPHLYPTMSIDPKGVKAVDRLDDAISRFLGLRDEGSEKLVPDDKHARVVFIEIGIVNAMMHTVMRGSVEHIFKRAKVSNESCVYPELVDQVEPVHQGEHPRCEAEEHDRRIKYPMQNAGEPTLPNRDAQVVMFARMVDDVEVPKEPHFVADSMEPVICEVIDEKEDRPGPPRLGWKFIRCEFIGGVVNHRDKNAEECSEGDAHKADENVRPGIACLVSVGMPSIRIPSLEPNEKGEDRDRNDRRLKHLFVFYYVSGKSGKQIRHRSVRSAIGSAPKREYERPLVILFSFMPDMKIVHYPDPVLLTVAKPVAEERFGKELEELVDKMFATMYQASGVGLAAPQVGISERIFVMDIPNEGGPSQKHAFINPEIIHVEGEQVGDEGCLSFPGLYQQVKRDTRVIVRAYDVAGQEFELDVKDLAARCVLHETDHCDGIVFLDRMSPLKRQLAKRKIKRLQNTGKWE